MHEMCIPHSIPRVWHQQGWRKRKKQTQEWQQESSKKRNAGTKGKSSKEGLTSAKVWSILTEWCNILVATCFIQTATLHHRQTIDTAVILVVRSRVLQTDIIFVCSKCLGCIIRCNKRNEIIINICLYMTKIIKRARITIKKRKR